MLRRNLLIAALAALVFMSGYLLGARRPVEIEPSAEAASANRVFELRTYTTHPGKLGDLQARFRNHTTKLFKKHGMTNVGYWVPQDAPLSENTLIYVLAYPSREAAKKSWDGFRNDPEWHKARDASEVNGKIVSKVESVFMDAADYSPMK
jgi:hypothetical protein